MAYVSESKQANTTPSSAGDLLLLEWQFARHALAESIDSCADRWKGYAVDGQAVSDF
jgi:hypothetical protein